MRIHPHCAVRPLSARFPVAIGDPGECRRSASVEGIVFGPLRLRPLLTRVLLFCVALSAPAARAGEETLAGLAWGKLESREVRVYVPAGGVRPETPLLIALDGQNMAQWHLAEALAALPARGRVVPLVVAVPAGKDRIEEYGVAGRLDYAGRGKLAEDFQHVLLEVVLPAVRARYGTGFPPARTGIMGSSLGGLAAFDLAWRHPDVFGFAGIFSGSFWWRGIEREPQASRIAHQLVRETPPGNPSVRFWFSAGTQEEKDDRDHNGIIDVIQDTTELMDELARHGYRRGGDMTYLQIEGGRHHETSWAAALPDFLAWVLPSAR